MFPELFLEGIDVDNPPILIFLIVLIGDPRSPIFVILLWLISNNFLLVISPLPSKLNVRFTLNSDVVIAVAVVVIIASFVVKLFVFVVNNGKCFFSSFIFKRKLVEEVVNKEEIELFSLCKVFSDDDDIIDT